MDETPPFYSGYRIELGYNEKLLFCDKRPRRKKRGEMTFGVRKNIG
jgi:hypothetical protein